MGKMVVAMNAYCGNSRGEIYILMEDGDHRPTGVTVKKFANVELIREVDLLDEIDIVYGPLSDGTPRRFLPSPDVPGAIICE